MVTMRFSCFPVDLNIKKNGLVINSANDELPPNDLFVL